jgi:ATP-binding cassette subfamily B protein
MKFLDKYIKKYWNLFLIPIGCLMVEVYSDLMQPTIMSKIIDVGVANQNQGYILNQGLVMIGIAIIGGLFAMLRNIVATKVSQDFSADLRYDLFRKIQKLSLENIDKFERATLITRLTNDVNNIQQLVYGMMRIFVRAPLLAIGCIFMAIRLDTRLSVVLIGIIPVVSIVIFASLRLGYPCFIKVQKALDKVNGVIRQYLTGVRVVKAFNRFNYEKDRFEEVNESLTSKSVKATRILAFFNPGVTLAVDIGIVVIIILSGIRINNGSLEVGKVIAFIKYMSQLLFALMSITMIFNQLVKAKASIDRLAEVFNEESTILEDQKDNKQDNNIKIQFEDVYFSYPGFKGEPVLKNINFTVENGQTIGIIGSTGSGKTTLINLMPRFYDVVSGKLKINNVNVKDYSFKELREKIAIVSQKALLFSGTIEENMKWGREGATLEEIEEACKVSDAYDFVTSFKDGFNTVLGQAGVNLSGGQKQRLSIARALVKKPEILILDDSTSAVDANTEYNIRTALKDYSKNLTTIIIAQRISSVKDADKIIVLDNGEIMSIGKHEELMQDCDIYKDIYKSQIGGNFDEKKGGEL